MTQATDSIVLRFLPFDERWPEDQTIITYSFRTSYIASDPRENLIHGSLAVEVQQTIREAMDAWEAVCGVQFVEVEDSADAELRIGFRGGDTDGPVGTAWSITSNGVITSVAIGITPFFDPAYNPNLVFLDPLLYDGVLHELGHALGIDHSDNPNAVMSGPPYTNYWDQPGRDQLTEDDITAAQSLWGKSENDYITGTAEDDLLKGFGGDDLRDPLIFCIK